jgi:D-threo-aldose 1-dehydrogenase
VKDLDPVLSTRGLGRTSVRCTVLGFGGGWLGTMSDFDGRSVLEHAWNSGVRYFDTAPLYSMGESERRLGRFFADKSREQLLVSTKVGRLITNGSEIAFDYSAAGALKSFEGSAERLGADAIDILLIHDIDRHTHGHEQPLRFAEALDGAYRTLSNLKSSGVVRAIGLGVNEWEVCLEFARRAPIDCCLIAGRHTLLDQGAVDTFLPFCLEAGISVIAGSPFNRGILSTGPIAGTVYGYSPAPPEILALAKDIQEICHRFQISLPAAALKFPLLHPAVATVIPGMVTKQQVDDAIHWISNDAPPGLWDALFQKGFFKGEYFRWNYFQKP